MDDKRIKKSFTISPDVYNDLNIVCRIDNLKMSTLVNSILLDFCNKEHERIESFKLAMQGIPKKWRSTNERTGN